MIRKVDTGFPKSSCELKGQRALPALSCPLMPEAAPARIASSRGATALAPHFGSHPECVPRMSEMRRNATLSVTTINDCHVHSDVNKDCAKLI